jgi:hypothetical protein
VNDYRQLLNYVLKYIDVDNNSTDEMDSFGYITGFAEGKLWTYKTDFTPHPSLNKD